MGDILEAIKSAPRQAREGYLLGQKVKITSTPQHIVFAGMGGSGIPGDLFAALLAKRKLPVTVVRDFKLPSFVNDKTLVIAISYSGNTEETLSAYRDAVNSKCKVLAITSGGKLAELCQLDKTPVIKVPQGLVPRHAIGYFLFALLGCFTQSGLVDIPEAVADQAIQAMGNEELARKGEELASQLSGKVPLVYTSEALAALGRRWKQAFNENGKVPAFTGTLTELCHNEVEGYASGLMQCFHVLLVRDERDHPGTQKRMNAVKELFREHEVTLSEIMLRGEQLVKLATAIQLGDYISYFLAKNAEKDPYGTPVIDRIKELVKK